jgi:hypothetical protein
MSTSATHSGTTTRAGRSGKGLGIAAATLAVVIAAGFVFAVNQGNQPSSTAASERAAQIATDRYAEMVRLNELAAAVEFGTQGDAHAEINRLNALAEQVKAESHPAFNIEKTKMELAGQIALSDTGTYGEVDLDVVRSQLAQATEYPGINPEKSRMDLTGKQLDDLYIPSFQPVTGSQPSELNQPEWDNRMP